MLATRLHIFNAKMRALFNYFKSIHAPSVSRFQQKVKAFSVGTPKMQVFAIAILIKTLLTVLRNRVILFA
jgi:hypothetical protein